MYAAASLIDLAAEVLGEVLAVRVIGVDEPMFVCGAIASTSAAWPITAPAESALDPAGETYTSTGTFAASIPLTIERIEDESPPGRVHLDHDGRRVLPLAAVDDAEDEVTGDGVDVGVELGDQDA